MTGDAQDLIDRRRLRRRLSFWRVAAIVAAAVAVLGVAAALHYPNGFEVRDHIARVSIEGLITEDRDLLDLLHDLKDDDRVKAVILRVDSPGGTTVGGETIYEAARELAAAKPVATEVGTLAASAGYMIAVAADHVVAHRTSIVGSIGVLFQYVDASQLLGKIGVDVNAIKSAPLKAEPSPFAPAPEAAKAMIQRLVMDTYGWFVALVAERRNMSEEQVRLLADGSIFTGQQGLQNKLIDAIGDEAEVRRWLEQDRGVATGLDIVDRKPADEEHFSLFASARSLAFHALGLDPKAKTLSEALLGAPRLDGLVSLWQLPQ
ncbi:signal peptide peptidase SppA [Aurantimonas sp. MSK8Z-1]|uniref:signal peptide peptidase SppA n=1 Tax=Mangrovibrevibacter kandeliae TaxID=2968473 RepID=UPI0021195E1C|nr:signal peptide peptidase SppA [Aurantimonas sp. MSK8Z-1]MCW4115153.1 signal peptide peptidase SppA [Aurantimonas sp. MSK8Z-1]